MRTILNTLYTINQFIKFMFKSKLLKAAAFIMMNVGLLVVGGGTAYAQSRTVTGKVLDANGPVVGAFVMEKGTNNGASTMADGSYSVKVSGPNAVLVYSSIGYIKVEKTVGTQSVINVTLSEDSELLADAVVVGYGSQLKEAVTGAISSVKEKDIKAPNAVSVDAALQGKVAGLTLSMSSAQPGSAVSANIRGELSPNGSNSPLYVIDGIVINSNSNTASKGGPSRLLDYSARDDANRSPLATLNPNDIASIDVLKDASAAAIYGSAAANGVILITTKSGQAGKPKVTYSGSVSVQKTGKYYEPLNSAEMMEQQNLALKENWLYQNRYYPYGTATAPSSGWPVNFTAAEIAQNTDSYNHLDEVFRTGIIHDHNVSVSGGTDKFRVYSSFNYYDNTSTLKGSDLNRISGRVNFSADLTKWLALSVNAMYTQNKANNPSGGHWRENANEGNLTNSALYFAPYLSLKDENGNLNSPVYGNSNNPLAFLMIKDQSTTNRLMFTPKLDVKIMPWLKFTAQYGFDYTADRREIFSPNEAKLAQQIQDNYGGFSNGYNRNMSTEEYLTFDKKFGKHSVNVVAGTGYYNVEGTSYSMTVFNLPTEVLENYALQMSADTEDTIIKSNKFGYKKLSFFARANYSYDDKYVLGLTFRRDGSSVFAQNHKWGSFPGISAAWNISNEDFLKDVNWIDFLKLRAGVGTSGNESILTSNYYTLTTYGSANGGGFYYFGGDLTNGVYQLQKGNKDLKWETDITFNAGVDYTLLNGRLSGSVDWYIRKAKDLLDFSYLPINDVMNKQAKNVGSTRSAGIELSVRGTMVQTKDIDWSAYFNISHNKSRWVERNPDVALYAWESQTDDLNALFGWETAGIFKTPEEITEWKSNGTVLQPDAFVGNLKYVDQNGDGKMDADDIVYLGTSSPFAIFGIGTSFRYKNWTLDIDGYGRLFQKRKYSWGYSSRTTDKGLNTSTHVYDRWSSTNPSGFLTGIATDQTANANKSGYNDYTLKNTHFLRLKNIKVTYTLPEKFLNNCKISSASVYLDLQNSVLFTNYEGLDPEMEQNSSPLPIPIIGVLGVNLSF